MSANDTPDHKSEIPANGNGKRRIKVGKPMLVFIWVAFVAYLALLIYFFVHYSSTVEEPSVTVNEKVLKVDEADSLLAQFFSAFEAGDYERARQIAQTLQEKYPDSDHARRAGELIATLDSEEEMPPVAQQEPPPPVRTVKPAPVKPPVRKKAVEPRPRPKTPPPAEREVEENEQRLRLALEKMRKERDLQRNITWYYHKNLSHYLYKNSFEIYIGQNDDGDVWLRMRIYYTGKDLLNIESYEINANDRDYTISTLYGNMQRGRGPGGAWEWYDAQVSRKEMTMIEEIMQPGPTAIRYIGKNGRFERMMTEPEKVRLKAVMEAYRALLRQQVYLSGLVRTTD